MYKLNTLQYPQVSDINISKDLSLNVLSNNEIFETLKNKFLNKYSFTSLNTFSFCKDGFLGLFLELSKKGKIAISLGESEALIQGAKTFEALGFEIEFLNLNKEGSLKIEEIKSLKADFIFISSYIMDTFIKVDLEQIKQNTKAKLISNASADFSEFSDAIYFDPYKLTGFSTSSVLLFNDDLFEEKDFGFIDSLAVSTTYEALEKLTFDMNSKELFIKELKEALGDDIYFFVDNNMTLDYSLHFALKGIKARELIRTLAFDEIAITNGEGCSLGLSKPSRIVQSMGYEEEISRNSISFSFIREFSEDEIKKIVKILTKKYKQIKVLNEQ